MIGKLNLGSREIDIDFYFLGLGYASQLNTGQLVSRFERYAENPRYKFFLANWGKIIGTLFELQKLLFKYLAYDSEREINCKLLVDLGSDFFDKFKDQLGIWSIHTFPFGYEQSDQCQKYYHFLIYYAEGDNQQQFCLHYQKIKCQTCGLLSEQIHNCIACQNPFCYSCLSTESVGDFTMMNDNGEEDTQSGENTNILCKKCVKEVNSYLNTF